MADEFIPTLNNTFANPTNAAYPLPLMGHVIKL